MGILEAVNERLYQIVQLLIDRFDHELPAGDTPRIGDPKSQTFEYYPVVWFVRGNEQSLQVQPSDMKVDDLLMMQYCLCDTKDLMEVR